MSNYTPTGNPVSETRGTSSLIRNEFSLIQTALNSKADPTTANTFTAANIFNAVTTFNALSTFTAGITATGTVNLTGATVTVPTPAGGDNSTKPATTAWVTSYYAPIASPALTGTPTAPTPATADNSTTLATTAHVKAVVATMPSGSLPAISTKRGQVLRVNADETGVAWAGLSGRIFFSQGA